MRRAVLEAEAVVSGFEDVAMVREPVEQRGWVAVSSGAQMLAANIAETLPIGSSSSCDR